jgi:CheY-like chemotaxis protein
MTLLCIDDDLEDTELLREAITLVDNTCTCVSATSGSEALNILRRLTPDHIILDINMPKMDGRETLLNIRRTPAIKNVPVHILSTTSGAGEIEQLKRLGATSFLTKPSTFDELCDFVRSVLKSGRKN